MDSASETPSLDALVEIATSAHAAARSELAELRENYRVVLGRLGLRDATIQAVWDALGGNEGGHESVEAAVAALRLAAAQQKETESALTMLNAHVRCRVCSKRFELDGGWVCQPCGQWVCGAHSVLRSDPEEELCMTCFQLAENTVMRSKEW